MVTITISKKLIKNDDLVAIPRREYEKLLGVQKGLDKKDIVVRRSKSFRIPKRHEQFYDSLDLELTEALKEYKEGRHYGPFETTEEGIAFLKSKKVAKPKR
ncbi:MAG: hypothetical protein Q7K26_02865 [bacterium]|nr:hypothetical protein [bacterium]